MSDDETDAATSTLFREGTGLGISDWIAPEPRILEIPTPDGSGQATHPSVVFVPEKINGFKYWMAMTPYPDSRDSEENPNILASNDGDNWQTPEGLTNPIDFAPGYPGDYNSDTNLVYDGELLILTWRQVAPNLRKRFFISTSKDGVCWAPKQVIATLNLLSQSLVKIGNRWRFYGIEPRSGQNLLVFWESFEPVPTIGGWGPRNSTSLPDLGPDFEPWHIEIQFYDGEFLGLLNTTEFNKHGFRGFTYLIHSVNGIDWTIATDPLWPASGIQYDSHYKSAFIATGTQGSLVLDVFAAVVKDSAPRQWNIGRTTAFCQKAKGNRTFAPD